MHQGGNFPVVTNTKQEFRGNSYRHLAAPTYAEDGASRTLDPFTLPSTKTSTNWSILTVTPQLGCTYPRARRPGIAHDLDASSLGLPSDSATCAQASCTTERQRQHHGGRGAAPPGVDDNISTLMPTTGSRSTPGPAPPAPLARTGCHGGRFAWIGCFRLPGPSHPYVPSSPGSPSAFSASPLPLKPQSHLRRQTHALSGESGLRKSEMRRRTVGAQEESGNDTEVRWLPESPLRAPYLPSSLCAACDTAHQFALGQVQRELLRAERARRGGCGGRGPDAPGINAGRGEEHVDFRSRRFEDIRELREHQRDQCTAMIETHGGNGGIPSGP
ncbi:hypothetical protein B0H17DRAFT_1141678 [Mycena rosella]|uniref:Uncharacterized protein n=1 Tax=Mycena rosella TaxID=1033263 RepID=A0AAD7CZK8_MYCRO|nr:hypothetical protein B0H17DRAFT_1141678 [Mycena rosella]